VTEVSVENNNVGLTSNNVTENNNSTQH